jgi:L,D-peptidoglycan transpeptidase YkuD (ErfK/YbiS/YcfS/YnhG family)
MTSEKPHKTLQTMNYTDGTIRRERNVRISNPASPTIKLFSVLLFFVGAIGVSDASASDIVHQEIVVEVGSASSTVAALTLFEVSAGVATKVLGPVSARVGRNGVKRNRREGDGTTPLGSFGISGAFGVAESPRVVLPYRRVKDGDCWISDVTDGFYNQWVTRKQCGRQNEDLRRIALVGPYQLALTTDYNSSPIVVGKGSAIFIHVHAHDGAGRTKPTSGCVSVSRSVMKKLFALLDPAKNPRVTIRIRS